MVRWFVSASVTTPVLGTGEVGGGLSDELGGVVHQLLRVRHLRVEMAHDVQGVDRERIGTVSLFLRNELQEFTSISDGLKLLL